MKRLRKLAWIWLLALVTLGGIFGGLQWGASILLGGLVSLLNLHWLEIGVDRILGLPSSVSSVRIMLGFVGRLVLILGVLFAMIHLSFLTILGGLLGLSIYVLAGFTEAALAVTHRGS